MPYIVGTVLSVVVAVGMRFIGFDRDRAFYPTILIIVGSYYVLFAAMAGATQTLLLELVPMTVFVITAIAGFKSSTWIVAAGLAGHGIFDAFHGYIVDNPGMPVWWPAFCGAYDVGAAVWLGLLLRHDSRK